MTEYWKSTAKYFCEFCKIWLTDDKPTRAMHEKGLKHQERVSKRLDEVKKNAIDSARAKDKLASDLMDIEKKAYAAFQKDVIQNSDSLSQYGFSSTSESQVVAESLKMKLKQQEDKLKEEEDRRRHKLGLPLLPSSTDSLSTDECWEEMKSPEGYIYYFNSKTKQKQWEKPKCLRRSKDISSFSGTSKTAPSSAPTSSGFDLQLPKVQPKPLAVSSVAEDEPIYKPGEKRLAAGALQANSQQPEPTAGKIKLRAGVGSLLLKRPKTEK